MQSKWIGLQLHRAAKLVSDQAGVWKPLPCIYTKLSFYCPFLTIPTLGTNSNPSFKTLLQWLNKTTWNSPEPSPSVAVSEQIRARNEHLRNSFPENTCIWESWVCTFLSEGFHAFYSNCPSSSTGRWSLAEMIEGCFSKSCVYWQCLSPALEVKITLLRLDQCAKGFKVYLTKIPCKTNETFIPLTP